MGKPMSAADQLVEEKTLSSLTVLKSAIGIVIVSGGLFAALRPVGPVWIPHLTTPAEAETLDEDHDDLGRW